MTKLTVKQKELLRSQLDDEWIKEFGLRTIYVYENTKGDWCYRYKEDERGNLYLTLTCRALEAKGYIVADWDCYDNKALCHLLIKGDDWSGTRAAPCRFVSTPIESLIKEK